MKITKQHLNRIIKEEYNKLISEQDIWNHVPGEEEWRTYGSEPIYRQDAYPFDPPLTTQSTQFSPELAPYMPDYGSPGEFDLTVGSADPHLPGGRGLDQRPPRPVLQDDKLGHDIPREYLTPEAYADLYPWWHDDRATRQ